MTTPERDPSELRDPALEAAWRALPRDEPPPALDAAILAAAHRSVHAKPQEAAAARAPWRWWAPLAAAATIGAVAISVIQLAPDEHASTAPVSDSPRVASRAPAPAAPRESEADKKLAANATTAGARDQAKSATAAGAPEQSKSVEPPASKADTQDTRLAAGTTSAGAPERAKTMEPPTSKADAMARSEPPKAVEPATKLVQDAPRKTTAGTIQRSGAAPDQAKPAELAASAASKPAIDANARSAPVQERPPAAMAEAPRDRASASMAQRSADPFPARPSAAEPAPQMEAKRKQEFAASSRDPQPFPAQPSPPAAAPATPPVAASSTPPPAVGAPQRHRRLRHRLRVATRTSEG
jgi:Meckel syndrome type 1 protein